MPPITDIIGFLISKDAFAVVGGVCFLIAYLVPRTGIATRYLKTDQHRAYLAVAVAVLPGLGLALTHHIATGTEPNVGTILQLAVVGLVAGLSPTSDKSRGKPIEFSNKTTLSVDGDVRAEVVEKRRNGRESATVSPPVE